MLGILSVNIWYFAQPHLLRTGVIAEFPTSTADQLVRFSAALLFEGKSYVIFSFLFGLSFVLAQRGRSTGNTRRALLRCGILILLGLLHGLFLFAGDILLAYGLLGLILLSLRDTSARSARIIAGVLYGVIVLIVLGLGSSYATWEDGVDTISLFGDPAESLAAYTGNLSQWFGFQTSAYGTVVFSVLLVQGPMAFAAFLIGLTIGRSQLLERIAAGEFCISRLMLLAVPALILGLGISALAAVMVWGAPGDPGTGEGVGYGTQLMATGLNFAAGPIQATGYVLLALIIFRALPGLTRLLAPAGRMSLSNYLGQSVVLVLLFSGLGLGLAGQLDEWAVGVVAICLWLTQLVLSALWLRVLPRGPVEIPMRAVLDLAAGESRRSS